MGISFNFDNSYGRLPHGFYTRIDPLPASKPGIVVINHALADALGLGLQRVANETLANIFSGSLLPEGAESLAQAYGGHQFGCFTILGDGRAHLIGEHITPEGKRFDIQLKGSGKTPYARRGDGRAALGPMLREYIISEAMAHLGIPTTRSLAVVTTGEPVYREKPLKGAVLTRVASSHLRVGTFEYLAYRKNIASLKQLADYTIHRHYPELKESNTPYPNLIKRVMQRHIALVVAWLRVGFIHGVMNTDNMAISGETIDYGPCAFMDNYDPNTIFSAIDSGGRYAYGKQPEIVKWNIARFAEAMLALLHPNKRQAITLAEKIIDSFDGIFYHEWLMMMCCKLGLFGSQKNVDAALIKDLLAWMHKRGADYTNTFRALTAHAMPTGTHYETEEFQNWWQRWQTRLKENSPPPQSSLCLMQANNPVIIPRNHHVEQALQMAEDYSDLRNFHTLLGALSEPYTNNAKFVEFHKSPTEKERVLQTFCGT